LGLLGHVVKKQKQKMCKLEMVVVRGQERFAIGGKVCIWYIGCVWFFPQAEKKKKLKIQKKMYLMVTEMI